ncbi:MAG: exonuclease [Nitrosopumilus sp.]|uniref:mRNA 3-end processing factor n=1 Tax=Nitrosopumilus zosterae TaxID=718286 RepID=A0A2S2KQQ6_9ARCH|nr:MULTISPECIES: exonuclease [Nitrosopumilus]MCV0367699.1 exonuclease [Nitrosopumilus sp.]BDQ30574.1 exonuclease [Nitrosopumilus zosterae]GBH33993.1 mRNA 3-end processing factor [Nitrosopumilus zosterae]
MTKNGILCEVNEKRVYLDPKNSDVSGINFVSHAHSDHLPTKNGGMILSSIETNEIANLRGFKMKNHVESLENFSLINSGHILGAKGLLFDDIFYTGDICTRDRGFLKGAEIPKCKTLITECTFGLAEFVFPKMEQIQKHVNELISELYGKGIPVILMGYQLGKAQTITQLFGHWGPLYLHDSVKDMNLLHQKFGISLKDGMGHSEAEKNGLLEKKPWVMVAPMMSSKNKFVQEMKSKYGAVTIGFSGWAQSSRFSFGRRTDYSIPMSDHCDFNELVDMVIKSEAEQVYTIHGFVDEFAQHLKKIGISAQPLLENSLDNFT